MRKTFHHPTHKTRPRIFQSLAMVTGLPSDDNTTLCQVLQAQLSIPGSLSPTLEVDSEDPGSRGDFDAIPILGGSPNF